MLSRLAILGVTILMALGVINSLIGESAKAFVNNGNIKVDGGLISGVTANGVTSYKGVPFAAPPVGDFRWKAPQPVISWQGVRQADTFGAECPQSPYAPGSIYATPPAKQSEDCLFLNIWTTANQGEKHPGHGLDSRRRAYTRLGFNSGL